MCGIAGFAGEGDLGVLERMAGAIRHRGPDGYGTWHDAAVAYTSSFIVVAKLGWGYQICSFDA